MTRLLLALLLLAGPAWGQQDMPAPGCLISGCTYRGPVHMGANTIDGSAIAFTGGTLDGVAIGNTVRSTVKATTGNFSAGLTATTGSFTSTLGVTGALTASGGVTAGTTRVMSGAQSASNAALWSNSNVSGGIAGNGGLWNVNLVQTTDTATWASSDGRRNLFGFTYFAGTGSVGVGWALNARMSDSGLTGEHAAGGSYTAGAFQATGLGLNNQGGTSGALSGEVWGANIVGEVNGTATYYNAVRGIEINMAIGSGASAGIKEGLKVTNQGTDDVNDALGMSSFVALGIGSTGASAMRAGIQFAGYSDFVWGWDSGSTLLDAGRWSNAYYTVAQNANYGFDAYAVNFTSGFLRTNGAAGPWLVDGSGVMQIGTARFTPSSSGLTIDTVGAYGTGAPTVTSGGSGYANNGLLFYGTGGVAKVTNASGGVIQPGGIAVLRQPYLANTSTPANPLTTTTDWRSTGTGATVTQSWTTTANELSLNPTGGNILVAGLPTSAPATHCALWVDTSAASVIKRTTCP